jgi:hypothetical protein
MREHLAHNVRTMFTHSAVLGVLVVGLVACGDDGPPPRAAPPTTTAQVATKLAPSQTAASTVAPPAGVPPCDVADLEFAAGPDVILIRNVGSIECEVDVSDSPKRDPLMEPSVWLDPGGGAELAVASDEESCDVPATVMSVDLVVNGERVEAPLTLSNACGVTLTAIYTAD